MTDSKSLSVNDERPPKQTESMIRRSMWVGVVSVVSVLLATLFFVLFFLLPDFVWRFDHWYADVFRFALAAATSLVAMLIAVRIAPSLRSATNATILVILFSMGLAIAVVRQLQFHNDLYIRYTHLENDLIFAVAIVCGWRLFVLLESRITSNGASSEGYESSHAYIDRRDNRLTQNKLVDAIRWLSWMPAILVGSELAGTANYWLTNSVTYEIAKTPVITGINSPLLPLVSILDYMSKGVCAAVLSLIVVPRWSIVTQRTTTISLILWLFFGEALLAQILYQESAEIGKQHYLKTFFVLTAVPVSTWLVWGWRGLYERSLVGPALATTADSVHPWLRRW